MVTNLIKNTSGTIAVASTATSKGVETVMNHAPVTVDTMHNTAQQIMSTADIVGICSLVILALSFLCTVYSTKNKHKDCQAQLEIDKEFYALRKQELELERIKVKRGIL